PTGLTLTYLYDSAGRALSVSDGTTTYASAASYEPHGALRALTNGASIVSTYFYNNRLQPCRISVKNSGAAPANCADATNIGNVLDFGYGFTNGQGQNNGNVIAIVNNRDANRSQSFTYDELNRIKTAQSQAASGAHDWGPSFGYDIWANLLSATVTKGNDVPMLSQSVATNNRLSGYSYDAAGNLLSDGSFSYTWDAESRMKSGAGVTYTYDGDGRRVKKSNGKLYWYGPGLDALLETDLAGNSPGEYIFFGGKRVARRQSSGTVNYYFSDHLGSSRVVASAAGAILDDSDFYPFGGERVVTSSSGNHYKFTGKERDAESGLDNFGARYFGSSLGRFMSPDDFWKDSSVRNPQSWNKYA
ncbi:MAG: RHS repeat-associated core domain-containing protein, partial [Candidatus Acidiferrales bacterium]